MSDELIPWGSDLAEVRKAGGELALAAEEKLQSRYRKMLRAELQAGPVSEVVARSSPAIGALGTVLDILWSRPEPGTRDVFEKVVAELLTELDVIRSEPASNYLVDDKTGKLAAPFTPDSVFRPPSFIDENGTERQASLTVHPGISSSLALAAQEEARRAELVRRSSDPMTAMALIHLLRPEFMAEAATERLVGMGLRDDPTLEGDPKIMEFGREPLAGERQSLNPRFHRAAMHSVALSKRVAAMCSSGTFHITGVKRREDGKSFWFEAGVLIKP